MGATQAETSKETDTLELDTDDEQTDSSGAEGDALTEDELFTLLSNRRRRYILHTLMREADTVDIGDLSQEIAAWEDGLEYEKVSSRDRKRVYTAIQQTHLPKMDDAGVVEFNRDRGTVKPTPALEDVEIYMDVVRGREIPWGAYYFGLTGLTGALYLVATSGLTPLSQLSPSSWFVFVIVSFGVSAIAHQYYERQNRLGITEEPPDVELEYHDRSRDN